MTPAQQFHSTLLGFELSAQGIGMRVLPTHVLGHEPQRISGHVARLNELVWRRVAGFGGHDNNPLARSNAGATVVSPMDRTTSK